MGIRWQCYKTFTIANIWQLGICKYISNMCFSKINIDGIMNFYNFKIKVINIF